MKVEVKTNFKNTVMVECDTDCPDCIVNEKGWYCEKSIGYHPIYIDTPVLS